MRDLTDDVAASYRKGHAHAALVFHAALSGDSDAFTAALNTLTRECDADGIVSAITAWCDTYIAHATGGPRMVPRKFTAWNVDTGELGEPGADTTPPAARWALRIISARASMDVNLFNDALAELNALPDGPPDYQRGRYVAGLVESLALTVNRLPSGYGMRSKVTTDTGVIDLDNLPGGSL